MQEKDIAISQSVVDNRIHVKLGAYNYDSVLEHYIKKYTGTLYDGDCASIIYIHTSESGRNICPRISRNIK